MSYRAAIIGAGRIGAMLDDPGNPLILTHAHGYAACEDFEIVGFVDRDPARARDASARWGGAAFESIPQLFEAEPVDLVSVCLPDELHHAALRALAEVPVRLIFLEKPAVRTPAEADEIRALYAELPVRVQVNYTRRFLPALRCLRDAIRNGDYGKFLTGMGYYGKGLLHNGSHMLDLLRFFLGEVRSVATLGEVADFRDDDPSVSALLTMCCGGVFHLSHIDSRAFHIFELDLTFERKRVRITELGTSIETYSVGDDKLFEGYRTLNRDSQSSTEFTMAMHYAIGNIRNNLDSNEPLMCPLEDSLETVLTCSRILRGGRE